MSVDQFRGAIATAPKYRLPDLAKAMWAACAAGEITEAEAEALDAVIQARNSVSAVTTHDRTSDPGTETPAAATITKPPVRRTGSRPRSPDSLDRRRRWAASGRMPPALAARYTTAEQATLAAVAAEIVKRGDCRMANGEIAARAGVSVSLARAAIRKACQNGHLSAQVRRVSRYRNETTILQIVSTAWASWLKLGPRTSRAERSLGPTPGAKFSASTNTRDKNKNPSGSWNRKKNGFRGGGSHEMARSRRGT